MTTLVSNAKDLTVYFAHKILTPIRGEPTFTSINDLYTEIKANASSISGTSLGGGRHGYLGLVISDAAYKIEVPLTPFLRPTDPGQIGSIEGTIAVRDDTLRIHNRKKQEFLDCNLLEKQLVQQILESIDREYLLSIKNKQTGLINCTIPELFATLFKLYGSITPHNINMLRDKIVSRVFDPSKQVTTIFNDIEDYNQVAEYAGAPETAAQLINLGLTVLTKSGMFTPDMRTWHAKPSEDRTWRAFVKHFQDAQQAIRLSTPSADSLGFHNGHANAIVQEPVQAPFSIEQEAAATAQWDATITQMANSAQSNTDTVQQLQALMAQLQSSIVEQKANAVLNNQPRPLPAPTPAHYPIPQTGNFNNGRNNQSNPTPTYYHQGNQPPVFPQPNYGNQQPAFQQPQSSNQNNRYQNRSNNGNRRDRNQNNRNRNSTQNRQSVPNQPAGPRFYCHTHGCCAHPGYACTKPAQYHQPSATFQNMMNGNTYLCHNQF